MPKPFPCHCAENYAWQPNAVSLGYLSENRLTDRLHERQMKVEALGTDGVRMNVSVAKLSGLPVLAGLLLLGCGAPPPDDEQCEVDVPCSLGDSCTYLTSCSLVPPRPGLKLEVTVDRELRRLADEIGPIAVFPLLGDVGADEPGGGTPAGPVVDICDGDGGEALTRNYAVKYSPFKSVFLRVLAAQNPQVEAAPESWQQEADVLGPYRSDLLLRSEERTFCGEELWVGSTVMAVDFGDSSFQCGQEAATPVVGANVAFGPWTRFTLECEPDGLLAVESFHIDAASLEYVEDNLPSDFVPPT